MVAAERDIARVCLGQNIFAPSLWHCNLCFCPTNVEQPAVVHRCSFLLVCKFRHYGLGNCYLGRVHNTN
jgi:hypothetical protein